MPLVSRQILTVVSILTILSTTAVTTTTPLSAQDQSSESIPSASQSDDAKLKRDVQRLVRQLDSDTLLERENAEKELIALGAEITQYLPAVNQRLSAEAANRLQRVRTALDEAAIESRINGQTVNLEGTLPLKDSLQKLEALGNVHFNLDDIEDEELTLALKESSFWQALDTLLDAAKLDTNLYGDHDSLDLFPNVRQVTRSERTGYSGAFRAEPTMVEISKDLSSTTGGRLALSVQIAWEPNATPIFMNIPAKSIRAKLDDGSEIAAANPLSNPEFTPVDGSLAMEVSLQFAAPPRGSREIREVSMEVVALLPGSVQTFRFEELDGKEEVKLKHGDLTIALEPVSKSGEFSEFHMSMMLNDPNGVFDSYRGWVLNKEAFVTTPEGKRLENQGFHTTRLADNEVGISYLFELPENRKGHAFVYEIPGSVVKKTIQLKMKNIPLP
ncbi:MAG: hypothetical protein JNK90_25830 [Planctomycetaceae bacterium]|nr:hypothetical protein [Planctomycetaceae bacterium]